MNSTNPEPAQPVQPKWYLGTALFVMGVLLTVLVFFAAFSNEAGKFSSMNMAVLFFAAILSSVGIFILFTNLLDSTVKPIIDEAGSAIADDIEDIRHGRITSTQGIVLLTILSAIGFVYEVTKHNALSATWGFVPVVVPTFLLTGVVIFFVTRTEWYQDTETRMPFWVFIIPLVGLLLSVNLGLNAINKDARAVEQGQPVGSTYYFRSSTYVGNSSGSNVDVPECTGKNCGSFYLLLLLIVVTLILVVGSAYIPFFWLLAGTLFLAIMWVMMLHEVRVR